LLQFEGFVNLGEHTSKKDEKTVGDHGIVFMFQPFRGRWTQTIGCYLSKNNVNGDILAKMCLEAIAHLENAGYSVDGIVSDGASWNRKMWTELGIDTKLGTCIHPMDNKRDLHFFSDVPHLIKNLRSFVMHAKEFQVFKISLIKFAYHSSSTALCIFQIPEGIVKLKHWEAVIKEDCEPMGLSITSKNFSAKHLKDDGLLKMNVKIAFQVSTF
jgi:hypothetical protein